MNLKQKICGNIDYLLQKGFTLISEDWGNPHKKCVCPLGCVLLMNKIDYSNLNEIELYKLSSNLLQVSENWIEAFTSGFDDCPYTVEWRSQDAKEKKTLLEANQLGKTIREKYL